MMFGADTLEEKNPERCFANLEEPVLESAANLVKRQVLLAHSVKV
jgi:hypothetical protein